MTYLLLQSSFFFFCVLDDQKAQQFNQRFKKRSVGRSVGPLLPAATDQWLSRSPAYDRAAPPGRGAADLTSGPPGPGLRPENLPEGRAGGAGGGGERGGGARGGRAVGGGVGVGGSRRRLAAAATGLRAARGDGAARLARDDPLQTGWSGANRIAAECGSWVSCLKWSESTSDRGSAEIRPCHPVGAVWSRSDSFQSVSESMKTKPNKLNQILLNPK